MQTTRQVFDQLCREFDPRLERFRDDVLIDGGTHALLHSDEEVRAVRSILMRILRDKIAERAPKRVYSAASAPPDFDRFLGIVGRTVK